MYQFPLNCTLFFSPTSIINLITDSGLNISTTNLLVVLYINKFPFIIYFVHFQSYSQLALYGCYDIRIINLEY